MKRFLAALQFLTVIPIKIKSELRPEDFGKALIFFPLTGLLIGAVLALISVRLAFLPAPVNAAVIIIISILLTGGIHLDGFADACDAFYGSNPKEKILEIMRDSRIGTMGAAGIVSILLLKFSLITTMPPDTLWKVLMLSGVFSRWIQSAACFSSPYARQDGKGRHFIDYASGKEIIPGLIFTMGLFLLLLNTRGPVLFFASIIPAFFLFIYIKKRIGGMTGDTIGALSEISEVSVLLFALMLN